MRVARPEDVGGKADGRGRCAAVEGGSDAGSKEGWREDARGTASSGAVGCSSVVMLDADAAGAGALWHLKPPL
jgi:hypothetical protein